MLIYQCRYFVGFLVTFSTVASFLNFQQEMPTVKIPSIHAVDTLWHWKESNPVLRSSQLSWRWSRQVVNVFFYCCSMLIHLAFLASGPSLWQLKQSQRKSWSVRCSVCRQLWSQVVVLSEGVWAKEFSFLEIHLLKWIEDHVPPARHFQCLCGVMMGFSTKVVRLFPLKMFWAECWANLS